MKVEEGYFYCLLEEYKHCKSEIMVLQKYLWRVQMIYVPSILITILGFYLKEVWANTTDQNVLLSRVLVNMFSDPAFITIIFWSALISLLIFLYAGNMMVREGRYLTTQLIPELNSLLKKKNIFNWERIATERLPISKNSDDSFQLYGDVLFGTLLLLLPISIAIVCLYQGFLLVGEMHPLVKGTFISGVVISLIIFISGFYGIMMLEVRHKRVKIKK